MTRNAIDETEGCPRSGNGDHQQRLVQVGGDHMLVVARGSRCAGRGSSFVRSVPRWNPPASSLTCGRYSTSITHGHRIGALPALDAQVALGHTLVQRTILATHEVSASGRSHDEACGHVTKVEQSGQSTTVRPNSTVSLRSRHLPVPHLPSHHVHHSQTTSPSSTATKRRWTMSPSPWVPAKWSASSGPTVRARAR